jgi:acyl-CoA thioesterase
MTQAPDVKPSIDLTPEETAWAAADIMWATDHTSKSLGMELLDVGPGSAIVAMMVRADMTNGFGMAHGGMIFTLADSAFAYACNSFGDTTVAAHCSISFIAPAKEGDRLIATAREVSRAGRSGIYDVQISINSTAIAEFRGHSRVIGGSFIKGTVPKEHPTTVATT